MEIVDCNNHVKNAINFFGPSCAVNSLINKYNPIGDNSDKFCSLCTGKVPGGKCTPRDPYAGFEGAFRCLLEAGEIAFLKHTTVSEMIASKKFRSVNTDRFELLCKDGSRKPLSEYRSCNWGLVPSHAVVTSSARSQEERKHYQRFMARAAQLYGSGPMTNFTKDDRRYEGHNRFDTKSDDKYYDQRTQLNQNYDPYSNGAFQYDSNRGFGSQSGRLDSSFQTEKSPVNGENGTQLYEKFSLFESERYGGRLNLMFQDSAQNLVAIKEEDQSFTGYLGQSLVQILEVRHCPVNRMTLCVTSDPELEKCVKMRVSFV